MIRPLFFISLLSVATAANARMQTMTCKGEVRNGRHKLIVGNVDREAGTAQTLLVNEYRNDNLDKSEYVYAREIQTRKTAEGRTQLWSEWMQDFELTLPEEGGEDATAKMFMQSAMAELSPAPFKCTFKDDSEETLMGRELCFNHRGYCVKFGSRYPKANEREQFLKDAIEFEKTTPILAARRLVRCEGVDKPSKTKFVLQGTMGMPIGDNPSVAQFTTGPFVINTIPVAGRVGESFYRRYKASDLSLTGDQSTKTVSLISESRAPFSINRSFDGTSWDVSIKGEKVGIIQSFKGKMQCEERRLGPDELAAFEHCHDLYVGCVAFRRVHNVDLPGPKDLNELRSFQTAVATGRIKIN